MSSDIFLCSACFELLFEPVSLPCSNIICKRCFRIPKTLQKDESQTVECVDKDADALAAIQSIGAYVCPSKNCLKTHRYQREGVVVSFLTILKKLFPQQQEALCLSKQGEELLMCLREQDPNLPCPIAELTVILNDYFEKAVALAPCLQLPYILRSKVLAEMGQFDRARQDSRTANDLNPTNKRGVVSEKLVSWLQMMHESKKCVLSELRDQIRQVCNLSCPCSEQESKCAVAKTLRSNISNLSIEDLECQLCLEPYQLPVATPCGHVFCKACLLKSLDHSRCCPLCRCVLPSIGYFINRRSIETYQSLLSSVFNVAPNVSDNFEFNPEWLPIYHSSLLFPTSSTSIHISEPQHRVMIKRCIETSRKFGVMLPPCPNVDVHYGTLVQITSFEPLLSCDICPTVDGNLPRYVVNICGVSRFKITDTRLTDANYYEALCTRVEDIEVECSDWDPHRLELLVKKARSFVGKILNTLPQCARLYFERKHGKMPTDPFDLSFWLGEILPLNPYILYKLLPIIDLEERLGIVCGWLEEACSNHT